MNSETRTCQNCKAVFEITDDDLQFYRKISVPAPTWCPECRMIRRFIFQNERYLFRKKESETDKEIFSGIHSNVPVKILSHDQWWSDSWDPMSYGKEYNFSKPFFEQFKELIQAIPWPAKNAGRQNIDSEYSNSVGAAKSAYWCFGGIDIESSAYVTSFFCVKNSFDLFESRHSELCYDCYMVDESHRVFFSVNVEDSHDIWFSRNLLGCSKCFGCINLRNKNYYIFNQPVSKEEYKKFINEFQSGSHKAVSDARAKAEEFWLKNPKRFTLAINVTDSTGEHIEHVKNVKESYSVHESENLKYCQMLESAKDSQDVSFGALNISRSYESALIVAGLDFAKFLYLCHTESRALEYSMHCGSSSDLFGCFGLRKKQYCILNKQYTKEEYETFVPKIKKHMEDMPYTDSKGRIYKYGEYYPPEFSPHAYNETYAQDFFPLTKEEAIAKGYLWREEEKKEFTITKKASELPDDIKDVSDDITKEIISCEQCAKPYQIIPMELQFYRRIPLPLPRLCVECRFQRRFKFVNPPKFWERICQCSGEKDDSGVYQNNSKHFHDTAHCPNEFKSSYAPEKKDIVYCENCYKQEVL